MDYKKLCEEHPLTAWIEYDYGVGKGKRDLRSGPSVYVKEEFRSSADSSSRIYGKDWEDLYRILKKEERRCREELLRRVTLLDDRESKFHQMVEDSRAVVRTNNCQGPYSKEVLLTEYGKEVCGAHIIRRDTWEEIYQEVRKVPEDLKCREKVRDLGVTGSVSEIGERPSVRLYIEVQADTWVNMYEKLISLMDDR